MIKLKEFKKGYYYYAEEPSGHNWGDGWKFIGKVINIHGSSVEYNIVSGSFGGYQRNDGIFKTTSPHHKSIKGVSKTKKGLFIYML